VGVGVAYGAGMQKKALVRDVSLFLAVVAEAGLSEGTLDASESASCTTSTTTTTSTASSTTTTPATPVSIDVSVDHIRFFVFVVSEVGVVRGLGDGARV
jgi:hypothetical protein